MNDGEEGQACTVLYNNKAVAALQCGESISELHSMSISLGLCLCLSLATSVIVLALRLSSMTQSPQDPAHGANEQVRQGGHRYGALARASTPSAQPRANDEATQKEKKRTMRKPKYFDLPPSACTRSACKMRMRSTFRHK